MADVGKIAEYLQDTEIAILKALLDKKQADMYELTEELDENQSVISRATLWLSNKKLISVKETPHKQAKLTDLALKYNSDFLPERRFLTAVKKPMMLPDIKKTAKLDDNEAKFSLGYLKKKGWIEFEKGKVQLTKEASDGETPEEALIEKLFREEGLELNKLSSTEKDTLQLLIKRNLGVIEEKTLREFSITDLGKKVTKNVGDVKRIGVLTAKMIKSREWEKGKFRRYDVEAPVPRMFAGKKQAYRAFLDEVKEELVSLGFQQMDGPLIENCFYNCDALYMPQDHPARGIHDMYFVKDAKGDQIDPEVMGKLKSIHEHGGHGSKGWGIKFSEKESAKRVLRSQGTAISARMMSNPKMKKPGKYFSIARVYRPEKLDHSHLTEFNQLEGIVIGKDANWRQLMTLMTNFAKKIGGTSEVKFTPIAYFPFTEPSVTVYMKDPKTKKWLEVMPAGIIRPEITKALGIDEPVLAWGFGVGRLFMIKENIKDIRQLFSYDLDYLREAKL